jgi:hypothetical protein
MEGIAPICGVWDNLVGLDEVVNDAAPLRKLDKIFTGDGGRKGLTACPSN